MGEGKLQTVREQRLRYEVRWPKLPLAIYREIAAHLRQVEGVETGLVASREAKLSPLGESQQFDYEQSQVGSLWIQYQEEIGPESRQRVDEILAYYSDRYGALEVGAES